MTIGSGSPATMALKFFSSLRVANRTSRINRIRNGKPLSAPYSIHCSVLGLSAPAVSRTDCIHGEFQVACAATPAIRHAPKPSRPFVLAALGRVTKYAKPMPVMPVKRTWL
jgi:hypothetical protein